MFGKTKMDQGTDRDPVRRWNIRPGVATHRSSIERRGMGRGSGGRSQVVRKGPTRCEGARPHGRGDRPGAGRVMGVMMSRRLGKRS